MNGRIAIATAVAALAALPAAWGNWCCDTVSPYTGCSGCRPAPGGYVQAGNNSAQKCLDTESPVTCEEQPQVECASLINANLYGPGCSGVIGSITITLKTTQCNFEDGQCSGG
jgi:hypothetical protein